MKPTKAAKGAAAIRLSGPLSTIPLSADRMACCNVCGRATDALTLWRAHDEHDRPIDGDRALVFLGAGGDHDACRKKLEDHPRLFDQGAGHPGCLPALCGPCGYREGLACTHPDLKANGGAGLKIEVSGLSGVVCFGRGRGGCRTILQPAVSCAGRAVKSEAAE